MEEQWLTPYLDQMEEMSRRFFRYFHDRIEQEGGLSTSQFFLLRVLQQQGTCTVTDLAQHLGMTAAGATGLIDRLVRADLVVRERDESDRRIVRISLSEAGLQKVSEARRHRRELLSELFRALSPAEVSQLVSLYEKMTGAIPGPGVSPETSAKE